MCGVSEHRPFYTLSYHFAHTELQVLECIMSVPDFTLTQYAYLCACYVHTYLALNKGSLCEHTHTQLHAV